MSKRVYLDGREYTIDTVTRYQEGASLEDMENGDAYETAYLVYDEEGDCIWDTTNYENVRRYFEPRITLKQFLEVHYGGEMVCINDYNLNRIERRTSWSIINECTELHNYEVISFCYYDNELCVRIDYRKEEN